jgi:hypothetical protein
MPQHFHVCMNCGAFSERCPPQGCQICSRAEHAPSPHCSRCGGIFWDSDPIPITAEMERESKEPFA